MKSFCRICLQTKECENINGLNIYFNEELYSVKVILEELSKLLITDINDVPLTICLSCINELTQTYSFLKKIKKGEDYIKTILSSLDSNQVFEIEASNSVDSNDIEEIIRNENYEENYVNFDNLIGKFGLPDCDSDIVYSEEEHLKSKNYQPAKDNINFNDFPTFEQYVNEIIIEEPLNNNEQNDIYCLPQVIESDEYNLESSSGNQNKEKIECNLNASTKENRSNHRKKETLQIRDNCSSTENYYSLLISNSNKKLKKNSSENSENNSSDITKDPTSADYDNLANNVFACNFCPQAFSTESFLNHHTKKLHKCSYCDKIFSKTLDLYEHGKIEHSSFKCKICYKYYSSSSNYKSHLKKIHNVLNYI